MSARKPCNVGSTLAFNLLDLSVLLFWEDGNAREDFYIIEVNE